MWYLRTLVPAGPRCRHDTAPPAPETHFRLARNTESPAAENISLPAIRTQELESLRRAFKRVNKTGSGKITVEDLMQELEFLGYKVRRDEAALMIWEVDDDADGCIDWEEFRTMFYRIRDDQTGALC